MKYRKSVLSFILIGAMSLTVFASQYKVSVKGSPIEASIKTINNKSMIGLREVGEALGLQVVYDEKSNQVSLRVTKNQMENSLVINLNTGLANAAIWGDGNLYHYEQNNIKLEVPPKFFKGRVYVPLRFVCDVFASPIHVSGKQIMIGDIFSSARATYPLQGVSSKKSLEDLERFGRDLDRALGAHHLILGYMREITNNTYTNIDTGFNDVKMETKAGQKMQKTYIAILLNMQQRFNHIETGRQPSKELVEALDLLVEVLYEDFARIYKMVD